MKIGRRYLSLAALGLLATTLALAAPSFAWTITPATPLTCVGTAWSSSCASNPSYAIGTGVYDTAKFTLSKDSPATNAYVSFKVYAAAVGATCASTGSALYSYTGSASGSSTSAVTATVTSGKFDTTGQSAGNYVWIVQVTYSDATPANSCEPFTLFKGSIPTPEFPLGLALLMALTIPALLLIRTRFVKTASPKLP